MTVLRNTIGNEGLTRVRFPDLTFMPRVEGQLNIANISDIHLAHDTVKTRKMITMLEETFPPPRMACLDVIIISGDLFDKRIPHDSDEAIMITSWMNRFLALAAMYKVTVLVLEGTPSHDMRQPRWMVELNKEFGLGADVRYYEDIAIDSLYEGGPTFLFIQDEVNADAGLTWNRVKKLLQEKGLEKVDFAVMHGMFKFQEPIKTMKSHVEENYCSIVRYRIMIGHHHSHAISDIIVVPGSPERLTHGQEEDKGHYQFTFTKEGVVNELFVINDKATVFETLDVVGKSFKEVMDLMLIRENSPERSNFRFKLSRKDETYLMLTKIKNRFPQFVFAIKPIEVQNKIKEDENLFDQPAVTSIREDNLADLVLPRISPDTPPDVMKEIRAILAKK